MKKIISLLMSLIAFVSIINANTTISEFRDAKGNMNNIVLLTKDGKASKIEIPCGSKGNSNGCIWIKPKEISKFRDYLNTLRNKYQEWNDIADRENVTDLTKDLPGKSPKIEFVWGLSTTFFADDSFKAKYICQGSVKMIMCYAKVKASNNQFASEFFTMDFYDVKDIDNLLDAISEDKINEALNKASQTNLFN